MRLSDNFTDKQALESHGLSGKYRNLLLKQKKIIQNTGSTELDTQYQYLFLLGVQNQSFQTGEK